MVVAYDNTSGAQYLTTSPLEYSITVGSGSNRLLVVGISIVGTASISAITYNGTTMTLLTSKSITSGITITSYLYYLVNPTSGSNTVSISWSGTNIRSGAISYTGVKQADPLPTSAIGGNTTGSDNFGTDITTTYAGSWVVDIATSSYVLTSKTGQATKWGSYTAQSDKLTTTAGSYNMGWTSSGSGLWTQCIAEIRADSTSLGSTLLTYNSKYVVTSSTQVTSTSDTLATDTQASQVFSLSGNQTILVIYQANNIHGSSSDILGTQYAISVDGTNCGNTWDSPAGSGYATRGMTFWVGVLGSGSHTITGMFARENTSSGTVTIDNRILLIYILNGDEFQYVDNPIYFATSSASYIDEPYAGAVFTPSGSCKALYLYNVGLDRTATGHYNGPQIAISVSGSDYSQGEKSSYNSEYPYSADICYVNSLTASSTTVRGRVLTNYSTTGISRRQFAILLFADSTLTDTITSDVEVSTTSNSLVDDTEATINRTISGTKELLVVAYGTKHYGTNSSASGECYGIYRGADRAHSRGSPYGVTRPNGASTCWAETLTAGDQTIKGRLSNNNSTTSAKITTRRLVALWLSSGGAETYPIGISETLDMDDTILRGLYSSRGLSENLTLNSTLSRNLTVLRGLVENLTLTDVVSRFVGKIANISESISLTHTLTRTAYFSRGIAETADLDDIVSRTAYFTRGIAQSIAISDAVTRGFVYSRGLAENLTLGDGVSKISIRIRNLAENESLSDILARTTYNNRGLSENLSLSDVVTRRMYYTRMLSESITTNDVLTRNVIYLRSITDTINLSDIASWSKLGVTYFIDIPETISLADVVVWGWVGKGQAFFKEAMFQVPQVNMTEFVKPALNVGSDLPEIKKAKFINSEIEKITGV